MFDFSGSELLFYGGIAIMILAAVLAVLCIVIFAFTGKNLRKKLNEEYGEFKGRNR
jgi:hypothetical protein